MAIKGLSDSFRLPVLIRVRLGVKDERRNGAPRETDYFVLTSGAGNVGTPQLADVLRLYGAQPKALRMMLPLSMDARHPQTDQELVWSLSNTAYRTGPGLMCRGDGGDKDANRGEATCHDKSWADQIGERTGVTPVPVVNGRGPAWRVPCEGADCRKYFAKVRSLDRGAGMLPGHDPDASCKQVGVLRAILLDPTPGVMIPLGIAEVATGSIHSMLDMQSGLRMLEMVAGRTEAIPFWLYRKPTTTNFGGKAQVHHTCLVNPDPEAQRYGLIPPREVMLSIGDRDAYRGLLERAPVDFESVREVIPRTHEPLALPAGGDGVGPGLIEDAGEAAAAVAVPLPAETEPDTAGAPVADNPALARPAGSVDGARKLSQGERDYLKQLAGIRADLEPAEKADKLAAFVALAVRAHHHFGDAAMSAETSPLSALCFRHMGWMEAQLKGDARRERSVEAASA